MNNSNYWTPERRAEHGKTASRARVRAAERKARGDIPRDKHPYTSTACMHALHASCRLRCKFCSAPCQCACHHKITAQDL